MLSVTNTTGLTALILNASGRNRSVHEEKLMAVLDPNGIHILNFKLLHNDVEWRTMWLVKLIDDEVPVEIWLDVDFDLLEKVTQLVHVADNGQAISIGSLVRYTHDEETLGVVLKIDASRQDSIMVHWQRALNKEDGDGLNGRGWFVEPKNLIKV